MRTVWLVAAFTFGAFGAFLLLAVPALTTDFTTISAALVAGVAALLVALLALDHRT